MKKAIFLFSIMAIGLVLFSSFKKEKHCVFRAVMNEDPVDRMPVYVATEDISTAVKGGLEWLRSAQQVDGGWGCGQHARQDIRDPHAVKTDPATTAMVAMALMRSGSSLDDGPHQKELKAANNYLMKFMNGDQKAFMQNLGSTQIQSKLGQNIDVVLATQYFSNLYPLLEDENPLKKQVELILEKGVESIEVNIAENGSLKGGTWAGVLQSSYANSALESVVVTGVKVDKNKLDASRKYQQANYNPTTEEASTADGAGIMLYAVSGSTRASAKEAKRARDIIAKAKKDGHISDDDKVNSENLIKAGLNEAEAMELNTAYNVYNSGKVKSQRKEVMSGFGNNGGEEFLSYLQTGESLVVNEDEDWVNWYDNITKTIMNIQNQDGSWNGHHCITSPVFCTATCISLLTINNDIERIKDNCVER